MSARESGTSFVCQPLSDCSLTMAACDVASQWPEGSPDRYPALISAAWICVARASSMFRGPMGFLAEVCFECVVRALTSLLVRCFLAAAAKVKLTGASRSVGSRIKRTSLGSLGTGTGYIGDLRGCNIRLK